LPGDVLSIEGLGRILGKFFDLGKPRRTLLGRAARHRRVHAPNDTFDAAESEDAVLPERFERITEHGRLTFWCGVGCVEDKSVTRPQKTQRNTLWANASGIAVSGIKPEHPIDPTLENCRQLSPPVRVEYKNEISASEFNAVLFYKWIG